MTPRLKRLFNRLAYLLIFLAGILCGFFLFDRILMPVTIHGGGTIETPEVVGIHESEAKAIAEKAGFDFTVMRREFSDSVPESVVISQQPKKGTVVKKGRKLAVVVSMSSATTTVPDVLGIQHLSAKIQLEKANLRLGETVFENSDSIKKDFVIRTDPPAGSVLPFGSKVDMIVSSGSETGLVKVPNFSGQLIQDAYEIGSREGLVIVASYRRIPSVPAKTIYSQDPKPGTLVQRGNRVYVVVARENE